MNAQDLQYLLETTDGHYASHRARFPEGLKNNFGEEFAELPDGIAGELGRRIRRSEDLIHPAGIPDMARRILKTRESETADINKPFVKYATPEEAKQALRCGILEKCEDEKKRADWVKLFKQCDAKGITATQMVQAFAGAVAQTKTLDKYGLDPDEDPFAE